jgi:hypothetical protein
MQKLKSWFLYRLPDREMERTTPGNKPSGSWKLSLEQKPNSLIT